MGNNKMTKNKMGNKEIDLTVHLENMVPIQMDVSDDEKRYAQFYCEGFIVKNVEVNDVEIEYILLDPYTLLNWIVSIVRNYDRFKEENK
jgi:hypothetical protein